MFSLKLNNVSSKIPIPSTSLQKTQGKFMTVGAHSLQKLQKQKPSLQLFLLLETKLTTEYFIVLGYLKLVLLLEKVKTYRKHIVKLSQHPEFSSCPFAFPLGTFFAFFLLFSFGVGDANKSKNTCSSERHKNPTEEKKKISSSGSNPRIQARFALSGCLSQASLLALMMS